MWAYQEIRTLGDYVDYYGRRSPDRIALVFGEHETSYGTLAALSNQVANGLRVAGVESGDRVV